MHYKRVEPASWAVEVPWHIMAVPFGIQAAAAVVGTRGKQIT